MDILSDKLARLHMEREEKNLKRLSESLLITAQNNAIRTNYVKVIISHTQQNSKSRFC